MRWGAAVVWLGGVIAGMLVMIDYVNDAEALRRVPAQLPITTRPANPTQGAQYTLLFFAHPRCPCTRASIRQLARIAARCDRRLAFHVYLYQPTTEPLDWHKTDLWREARQLPSVEVVADIDGRFAKQCGAWTSGTAILYHPDGRLAFQGGVTAGRGHEADNAGSDAVVAIVRTGTASQIKSPVFGCPIVTSSL